MSAWNIDVDITIMYLNDVQNKIRCLPFSGQNITEYTMQLQVIYGGHSAVLPLF